MHPILGFSGLWGMDRGQVEGSIAGLYVGGGSTRWCGQIGGERGRNVTDFFGG
jgi:hypothetical protein